jgi:hypothetical protein
MSKGILPFGSIQSIGSAGSSKILALEESVVEHKLRLINTIDKDIDAMTNCIHNKNLELRRITTDKTAMGAAMAQIKFDLNRLNAAYLKMYGFIDTLLIAVNNATKCLNINVRLRNARNRLPRARRVN